MGMDLGMGLGLGRNTDKPIGIQLAVTGSKSVINYGSCL